MSDDAFGNWLSGFVDGEGCFMLKWFPVKGRTKVFQMPGARFEICLREDDSAVLEQIKTFWGIGRISHKKLSCGQVNPQALYYVSSTPELASVLVPHFERYPLRAKKSRDFAIWRQGVDLLHLVYQRPSLAFAGGTWPKWSDLERETFDSLFRSLKEVRRFVPPKQET